MLELAHKKSLRSRSGASRKNNAKALIEGE